MGGGLFSVYPAYMTTDFFSLFSQQGDVEGKPAVCLA